MKKFAVVFTGLAIASSCLLTSCGGTPTPEATTAPAASPTPATSPAPAASPTPAASPK
ncbi:hypothetical protein [Planktothrix serta]|uniref:hypothetical protein n=1 Tax=Planktothrix serta TaxID=1678310 RepID=UPI0018CC6921|nr:hypothetical protein [Planktothrix serta]